MEITNKMGHIKNKLSLFALIGYLFVCVLSILMPSILKQFIILILILVGLSLLIIIKGNKIYRIIGYIALSIPLITALLLFIVADTNLEARQIHAKLDIETLINAINKYRNDTGAYPNSAQGLHVLIRPPALKNDRNNWPEGGYLKKKILPKDPWGNDYIYIYPGKQGDFDVISFGADGKSGGKGENKDICSWELK